MEYGTIYLILAAAFGLFMAWGIGANDVANAMATSVGSRVLTIKQAVIIAAVFEFTGAVLAGGQVTATIRKGILDGSLVMGQPDILVWGMLAALAAAGCWLLIASRMGWPVSTTHSIIGAIVGFAIAALGWEAVMWPKVATIVASWVVSPLLAGSIAYLMFRTVQTLILDRDDPVRAAKRCVPIYIFLTGFMMSLVTFLKGLKNLNMDLSTVEAYTYAALVGAVVAVIGKLAINRIKIDPNADRESHYTNVERIFGVLMIVTACAMAFAHGSNDVANAVGPMAAIISVVQSGGDVGQSAGLPVWVLLIGGIGIVAGLLMLGARVIATVGRNITQLTPSRGFACELSAATTVVLASGTGLPISTTHTLVGAVLGVGLARGLAALDLSVVRTIFMSWIVTLPAGGFLAVIFFWALQTAFG
ncbi:inorganic phosphate transporter [Alkalilimnicola sp. S0819]|uniref:inorganic phosphate transporter n=1 Tax=Alkalilimnicola sp. S0819 TaxID=2613922 RepID=UPI001261DA08|nr:inorganic phosphate transporter [Alkalilimnicola sp. S0819]KAB7624401.1 inorganic phosphate transporter [Alkalilimnicola sp. S0819]MPQ16228.1 phosphate permease [Alkalilimnicola sp. S0819]